MNSIVYHLIIERYSMKTLHLYFPWATALDLYYMTGRGEKLQQLHCYHPFSDSSDIYLTKNHYENYSPKMVPIAKIWGSGSWTNRCCNQVIMHYSDVIMNSMTPQITSLTIVYSTVHSGADKWKHQGSASLVFGRGIDRWPINSPHKGPVMSSWTEERSRMIQGQNE